PAREARPGLENNLAVVRFDAVDIIVVELEAAVRERGIRRRELGGRDLADAEHEAADGRRFGFVETETPHVLGRPAVAGGRPGLPPDALQDADRSRVQRTYQRLPHRDLVVIGIAEIVGPPWPLEARVPLDGQLDVVDDRREVEAVLERGRKDEGLERRAGLAPAHDGAVELAL